MGEAGELLLDPDLRGVGDPHLVVEHARRPGDVLAAEPDAALLHQLDHPLDVVWAAGDAGADQAARGIQPELLVVDDGGGVELLGQVPGRERVGAVEPLLVGQLSWVASSMTVSCFQPSACGLLAPEPPLVGLHLAEPSLGACLLDDVEFPVGREVVPVEALALREPLGLVQDLLVALAEGPADVFRDRFDDDRLLVLVVADLDRRGGAARRPAPPGSRRRTP